MSVKPTVKGAERERGEREKREEREERERGERRQRVCRISMEKYWFLSGLCERFMFRYAISHLTK